MSTPPSLAPPNAEHPTLVRQRTFGLDDALIEYLREQSKSRDVSKSQIVREALILHRERGNGQRPAA